MPLLLALMLLWLSACGRGEESGTPPTNGVVEPGARYENSFWFVGGGEMNGVGVLEFETLLEGATLLRTARGWAGRPGDGGWTQVLDTALRIESIREPWRLLPIGQLKILIDDAGSLEAIVHDDPSRYVRLVPGTLLGVLGAEGGAELVLQEAELRWASETWNGVLLETKSAARPLVRHGGEAPVVPRLILLTDGAALQLLLIEDAEGNTQGWLRDGDAVSALLDPAVSRPDFAVDVLPTWILETRSGGIRAELRSSGTLQPSGPDGPRSGHHAVSGWFYVGDLRRPVMGLIRERGERPPS